MSERGSDGLGKLQADRQRQTSFCIHHMLPPFTDNIDTQAKRLVFHYLSNLEIRWSTKINLI